MSGIGGDYLRVTHPCASGSEEPLDLHVLSTPPAFVLSQDQTLRCFINKVFNLCFGWLSRSSRCQRTLLELNSVCLLCTVNRAAQTLTLRLRFSFLRLDSSAVVQTPASLSRLLCASCFQGTFLFSSKNSRRLKSLKFTSFLL